MEGPSFSSLSVPLKIQPSTFIQMTCSKLAEPYAATADCYQIDGNGCAMNIEL